MTKYIIIEFWGDRLLPITDSNGYLLEFSSRSIALEVGARNCVNEYRVLDIERFISKEEHNINGDEYGTK